MTEEKDIGVIIDDKLSFSKHMASKIKKANSVMGLIRRTYSHLDEESFLLLYKGLVRPHLEYANQIWSPILKKDIVAIENVQRRATKQIPGFRDLSYEERLRKLKLPTLKYRRIRGDVIEMYKILTGKYDPRVSNFVKLSQDDRRGHRLKIYKEYFRLNVRKNYFVNRTVNIWNNLPSQVIAATSVKNFEKRLDRFWKNEGFVYDINENLQTRTNREHPQHELTLEADENAYQSEEAL